jgi:hypothetical protein
MRLKRPLNRLLDHKICSAADQKKVLDAVAADQDELSFGIHRHDVRNRQARGAVAPAAETETPSTEDPQGDADKQHRERGKDQKNAHKDDDAGSGLADDWTEEVHGIIQFAPPILVVSTDGGRIAAVRRRMILSPLRAPVDEKSATHCLRKAVVVE